MPYDLTHASFFSGVGGLDIGLERAGWRTVSFSEIDPYASAVLAERFPEVPNLGDITALPIRRVQPSRSRTEGGEPSGERDSYAAAVLWSGGFPCQDLSVAGKRRGMGTHDERADTRSGLAYAFLDLVERHRPPAILLENVPGLLSSHAGKDFGALLSRLAELGYWWAYRVLDAQFFGVPQRRRRVFICALHAGAGFGADGPAEVLSVGARCGGHSAASDAEGPGTADGSVRSTDGARGPDIAGSLSIGGHVGIQPNGQDAWTGQRVATARSLTAERGQRNNGTEQNFILSPSPDASGVREADGLAGRLDHREVVGTLRVGPQRPQDGGPGDTVPIIAALDTKRGGVDDNEAQAGQLIVGVSHRRLPLPGVPELLPLGLDSHRYRCCGNGVVAPVSEWIGWRIRAALEGVLSDAA